MKYLITVQVAVQEWMVSKMKYEVFVKLYTDDLMVVEADSEEEAIEEAKEIFQDCFKNSKWWKDLEAEITRVENEDETE